jgi:uncharacterized protein YdhG (YjbR/CyaY superfamily)
MTVIDEYLARFDSSTRKELERIRNIGLKYIPDAEEVISYAMPTIKSNGKSVLGFDAHKEHIGIYPYSGQVPAALADKLGSYGYSKGAIRVPYGQPISEDLLKLIIVRRLDEIA